MWNKYITCHVTCVVTDISYFHLSKQSRPSSGSSYKRILIWVNSVCKSVKVRLCEDKQERPFIFYTSIPAKVFHCSLVYLKCVDIVELNLLKSVSLSLVQI